MFLLQNPSRPWKVRIESGPAGARGVWGEGGSDLTSYGGKEGGCQTVASQFWKKRKRETLKSPDAHIANAILSPPWLPPLLLQESSHTHEHKTSTEIARIHVAMSCATSYLHLTLWYFYTYILYYFICLGAPFYMHVEHIHIRPFHSHSRHKCKILSMKAQAINYVVSERKAMILRPTAILFHC